MTLFFLHVFGIKKKSGHRSNSRNARGFLNVHEKAGK